MQIKTDSQAAGHHGQRIASGGAFADIALSAVTGGDSTAVTRANALSDRMSGVFRQHKSVLKDSAGSIEVLSNNMVSFDQQASRQLGGR